MSKPRLTQEAILTALEKMCRADDIYKAQRDIRFALGVLDHLASTGECQSVQQIERNVLSEGTVSSKYDCLDAMVESGLLHSHDTKYKTPPTTGKQRTASYSLTDKGVALHSTVGEKLLRLEGAEQISWHGVA